jgi:hypothetical protein
MPSPRVLTIVAQPSVSATAAVGTSRHSSTADTSPTKHRIRLSDP